MSSLNKLFSMAVQKRDNHTCRITGNPSTEVHHIILKSESKLLRWDMDNAIAISRKPHDLIHKVGCLATTEHAHSLVDYDYLLERKHVLAVGANRIDEKEIEKRLKDYLTE